MKNARLRWTLRLLIAFIWVFCSVELIPSQSWVWIGLLAAVPPISVLAFNSSAGFYTSSIISILIGAIASFFLGNRDLGPPLDMAVSLSLSPAVALLSTLVCYSFVNGRIMRSHSERQALEDLEEEVATLSEKVVEGETALARNENKRKRYSRLQEAAAQLGTTLELDQLAQLILGQTLQVLQDRVVTLTLHIFESTGKELLRLQVDHGAGALTPQDKPASEDPLNQWVISRGTTLIIRDLEKDFRFRGLETSGLKGKCFYISPLLSSQGQVTGLVRVEALAKDSIDNEDQRLMESLVVLASLSAENAKLYRETQELAVTDGLTKLLLRRPLLERLEGELKRASQTDTPLSFILLDIDHFKSVNDTFGHPAGDKVLREIASLVKKRVRDVDLCGRYGGEEFAVLLPATDIKGATLVAERIREGIRKETFELRGESRTITVSLGVSSFPGDATTMQALIERADEALYRSKENGRDRVTAYSEG
jgi:diguanylate cyclase (GGDEF)-like protein